MALPRRLSLPRCSGWQVRVSWPRAQDGKRNAHTPPAHLAHRAAAAPARRGDSPVVFPDARGGYRDRNNVEREYRTVRADTAFEWIVPHTYRKTVATRLNAAGLSARVIADQLGHSRIS